MQTRALRTRTLRVWRRVVELVTGARFDMVPFLCLHIVHGHDLHPFSGPCVKHFAGVLVDLDFVTVFEPEYDQRINRVAVLLAKLARCWIGRGHG